MSPRSRVTGGRGQPRYEVTAADRAAPPSSVRGEPRYLGYRDVDLARPYAHFFEARTARVQDEAAYALIQGMAPTEWAVPLRSWASSLQSTGEVPLETGWTRLGARTYVAVRTDMPGVEAHMWQWWFGWHSRESARYKLWNPDAHQFAAIGDDRAADRSLTDEQRYVGNVSYVDEYIGGRMQRLAIRFVAPSRLGFEERPGWAHICARVGFSNRPLAFGWLVHQLRPTADGCEMRSRFLLNEPALLATSSGGGALGSLGSMRLPARLTAPALPVSIGRDMVEHCAAEMNHLARFLPGLWEEFRDVP